MDTFDPSAVLAEAREIQAELRRVRRAIIAEGDPERAAEHRADRERLSAALTALADDPAHRAAIDAALTARAAALRTAVHARSAELAARAAGDAADEIVQRAIAQRRSLTARERTRIIALRAEADDRTTTGTTDDAAGPLAGIATPAERDGVLEALGTLRLREARAQLRAGLLLTGQMRGIIAEAVPALLRGDPVLLLGETGGAKTALAEHLARTTTGAEPELVSGYGDISSAQVIGTHELRAEGGATVSVFTPGPLLRAMQEGRAVILDEVNAMPAEFLKRLNRILQLRPGDTLRVQEDAGREVRIAPGFAILATANEQTPHRYRGVDRLSSELVNRFGANSYRVHYPDTGVRFEDFPVENGLLAAAAAVDADGVLPSEWRAEELVRVARAAFISQQVFSGAVTGGFGDYVSTEREIDGRPGLEESVLAPRTLVAMVQKVTASAGSVTLESALTRFVEGVMHREDRRVLALILEGQGFSLGAVAGHESARGRGPRDSEGPRGATR
ncbi:AAA family ATPase [Leucobacter sp. PH1c]|uniref:AAA family ATPase n=1 Tax=Leucobacter sp. PH1c TaxID=1397278 RepID=UPI000E200CAA|nr:AAA family ATPase [Leucobacter sp. PH1c]